VGNHPRDQGTGGPGIDAQDVGSPRALAAGRPVAVLGAILIAGAIPLLVGPSMLGVADPRLDLVIGTLAAAFAGIAATAAIFVRDRLVAAPFQAGALLAIFASESIVVGLAVANGGTASGVDASQPDPVAIYFRSLSWLLAGTLSLAAAQAASRGWEARSTVAVWIRLGPPVALLILLPLLLLLRDLLPPIVDARAFEGIAGGTPEVAIRSQGDASHVVLPVATAVLFAVAALGYIGWQTRSDGTVRRYVAAALAMGSVAMIHDAFQPGSYEAVATSGDVLHAAVPAILLAGTLAGVLSPRRPVAQPNLEGDNWNDHVARVAIEERTRIAREIHDGLAQELWYAKLNQDRLCRITTDPRVRSLGREVAAAVDIALTEAQQAMLDLRTGIDGETPFADVVAEYLAEFSDRFGLRTSWAASGIPARMDARAQAELLRILQEALNNVRKHADATRVSVSCHVSDGQLRLTIEDNGKGFDPDRDQGTGFGLQSMRERAAAIGGELAIDSRPLGGTVVSARILIPGNVPRWP
jgi:signal transduction histidine kinase